MAALLGLGSLGMGAPLQPPAPVNAPDPTEQRIEVATYAAEHFKVAPHAGTGRAAAELVECLRTGSVLLYHGSASGGAVGGGESISLVLF
jgi:hypothetical protein